MPPQHLPPIHTSLAGSPHQGGDPHMEPPTTTSSKRTIGAGKPALWRSFTPMWGGDQWVAPPLWTWWAPPCTSYGPPRTK